MEEEEVEEEGVREARLVGAAEEEEEEQATEEATGERGVATGLPPRTGSDGRSGNIEHPTQTPTSF